MQRRRNEFESGRAPVRRESGGPRFDAKCRKCFCWSCPSTFLALEVQLVVFVSAFVMVITVWSVSCLLFSTQRFVNVGAHAPVPYGVGVTGQMTPRTARDHVDFSFNWQILTYIDQEVHEVKHQCWPCSNYEQLETHERSGPKNVSHYQESSLNQIKNRQ